MKSTVSSLLVVLASAVGTALAEPLPAGETPPDALRRDHPRIFFNAETWPAVKARALGPARAAYDALLTRCAGYPDAPKCSGTGPVGRRTMKTADGRTVTTSLAHTGINNIVEFGTPAAECAFAWRMTGERKYLAKAVALLKESIRGYHEAYRNKRAVNWYATTRAHALCAYDWLCNDLDAATRREIIVPLLQHVEDTVTVPGIIRRNDGNQSGTTGFYGVESLLWYAGLAAAGDGIDDDRARRHLEIGYALNRRMLAFRATGAGDDGALSSATPGYAMGCYPWAHFNFFHTYLSAYGRNVAADYPAMAYYPNWVYWTWIPQPPGRPAGVYSGVGDDQHVVNDLPLGMMYEHLTQYMHFYRETDPAAARLAATLRARCPNRSLGASWPVYPFIMDDSAGAVAPLDTALVEAPPLKARHFETLGQFVMRTGWRPDDTYAFFFAGATVRMHKHYDENSFVIYKRDFLALDSGSRAAQTDYNLRYYYAQTIAHNAVVINRAGEPMPGYWGPEYDGPEGRLNDGGQYGAPAKVLAFSTDADLTYAAADAAAAYNRPGAEPKCDACVRQFVHVLPDAFVVYDRVRTRRASDTVRWLLHTQNEPSVTNGLLAAKAGEGRLYCRALLPAAPRLDLVGGEGREFWSNGHNWDLEAGFKKGQLARAARRGYGPYWGGWRLEVSTATSATETRFLNVLNVGDARATPVEAARIDEGGRDGVRLVLRNQVRDGLKGTLELTLLFNRTGVVGGLRRGVFRADDGSLRVLAEQPLATTVQKQKGVIFE